MVAANPLAALEDVGLGLDMESGEVCEIAAPVAGRGDVRVRWKKNDPEGLASAREAFKALKEAGYAIFAVDASSITGRREVTLDKGRGLGHLDPAQAGVVEELTDETIVVAPLSKFPDHAPKRMVARPPIVAG